MTLRAVVKGVGHYLPTRVVPNAELEALVQTSDEWIRSRSGIERRHFVAEGQTTSDLATLAALAALSHAGFAPDDIDAIVLATSTADLTFPSAATMVQGKLGMTQGFAFDVQAVCAGFVYALSTANALIVSGQAKRVLVIGGKAVPFALARIPQGGEVRGNLAAGGKGVAQPLSARDQAIAADLGPQLAQRGLLLVGLDVIGDCLTEVNVTSPTCFREIMDQTGFDVAAMFVDALEQALA